MENQVVNRSMMALIAVMMMIVKIVLVMMLMIVMMVMIMFMMVAMMLNTDSTVSLLIITLSFCLIEYFN